MSGTNPLPSSKSQDHRPTREVIAEAITALKNETPAAPTLTQFADSIHAVEDRLKSHISKLGTTINTHTSDKIEYVVTQQQHQHTHLAQQLQLLTSASRDYSLQMSGIFLALTSGPSEGPPPNPTLPQNIIFDV